MLQREWSNFPGEVILHLGLKNQKIGFTEFRSCHGLAPLVVHVRIYQYWSSNDSASPPDVRRGSAPPQPSLLHLGSAPGSGSAPLIELFAATELGPYPSRVVHSQPDILARFEHWTTDNL
jgi:hypothetical protein